MRSKTLFLFTFAVLVAGAPALAGDLGLLGSYWDTDALGETAGGGVRYAIGDAALRLELRGSYFPDLTEDFSELVDDGSGEIEVEAIVPEAGIAYNFAPGGSTQFYLGAGLSYYLLDATDFELDDEVGYYGVAGLNLGGRGDGPAFLVEVMYRSVEGTVEDEDLVRDVDVDLSGPAANIGVLFRF
ncbi:MAG: hypothetical protein ACRD2Z_18720 [Thermoanaerobaculia bacterium]